MAWTLFRFKIMLAGVCAMIAGLSSLASGIDGLMLLGAAITACGLGLVGITVRSIHQETSSSVEPEITETSEGRRTVQSDSTCDHNWVNPDDPNDMLNYSYLTLQCTKCGAERSAWG